MSEINYDNYETVEDLRWFFDNNYGPHANKMARHVVDRLEQTEKQRDNLLVALTEVLARLERVNPLPENGTSSLREYARAAIAAAKESKA